MNATLKTTIRQIVSADFRAAAIFHRFGIDFCCGGARTVADACRAKNVAVDLVLDEIAQACEAPNAGAVQFETRDAHALIARIVDHHHAYVRTALPVILAHTAKVAEAHGARHAELHDVAGLMTPVAADLLDHMEKEEAILFPYVEALAAAVAENRPAPDAFFGTVANPIAMMEQEHEHAGESMAIIRDVTDGYRPPEDACTTYRICLQELEAFEKDLLTHVHLENNLLFPEALRLEGRLRAANFSQ